MAHKVKNKYLLEIKNLTITYLLKRGFLSLKVNRHRAINKVSFNIEREKVLGLLGTAGSGRTTLGKSLLRLIEPSSGQIFFENQDIAKLSSSSFRNFRRKTQILFNNPRVLFKPDYTVRDVLLEPFEIHKFHFDINQDQLINNILLRVSLDSSISNKQAYQLSDEELILISLARVLSQEPEFLILDEISANLDDEACERLHRQILKLKEELNLTIMLIDSRINVLEKMSDNIAVMYLGNIIEYGNKEALLSNPKHPYTKLLIKDKLASHDI